uniref:CID domain-containing protein n=1 Tax=Syphacia muris TaxID=451379 RepID=A0A0N5AT99_9BILA
MSRPLRIENIRAEKMSRTKAIAVDMLAELFKNSNFESYLVDVVIDSLQDGTDNSTSLQHKSRDHVTNKDDEKKIFSQGALSLQLLLSSVIETFVRSFDLALCSFDMDRNCDGALIYSVSVIVRSFTSSELINLKRYKMVVRRISSLLSVFATRISTPFHIANSAFFASSLCELLYEFQSHCSSKLGPLKYFASFRSSIDDFYEIVVKHLNEMAHLRKRSYDGSKKEGCRMTHLFGVRMSKSTPSCCTKQYRNLNLFPSKGRNVNQKIIDRRRKNVDCSSNFCCDAISKVTASRCLKQTAVKTNKVLNDKKDNVPNQLKSNAHRLAKEITAEVVEDLARRVERACYASRINSLESAILNADH